MNTIKLEIGKGIGCVSRAIHRESRSALRFWMALGVCAALSACGGGGGSTSDAPPQNSTVQGSTTITQVIASAGSNTVPITVTTAPSAAGVVVANVPFVSVTVCVPGTANCTTIDHVQVDTGSSGFRVLSTALAALPGGVGALTATIPPAGANAPAGSVLGECMQFADGIAFGSVRKADVSIGNEKASGINIEVIGDPSAQPPTTAGTNPSAQSELNLCASPATQNTAQDLHANAVLGVGTFATDCGSCTTGGNVSPMYYKCTSGSTGACTDLAGIAVGTNFQVQNPVAELPVDNNGVIVELPAVPATGAPTASGMLVFGIGTQTNNALGNAQVFATDAYGNVSTVFNGTTLTGSFFDSGSNSLFFPSSIATCSGATEFYCPSTVQALSALVEGINGINATVNFSVANTNTLTNSGNLAFNDQAGSSATFFSGSPTFDWGLPAFYGRNVFTAISGASTPGGPGPYYAF